MLFNEIAYLISITTTENDMGDIIETETKKQVFADELSYRSKSALQAMASGLKPKVSLAVKKIDYSDELKLEYKSKKYHIIDTPPYKNECVELICEGLVNNNANA